MHRGVNSIRMQNAESAFSVPPLKPSDVLGISFWLSGAALSLSLCAILERSFLSMVSRAIWLLIIFDQQEALARDRERQKTSEIEVLISWAFPFGVTTGRLHLSNKFLSTPSRRNRDYPCKGLIAIKQKEAEIRVDGVVGSHSRHHTW